MVESSKVNVKLSDTRLKKLKTAVKDKTGTTLRKVLKCFMEMICHMNYYWQSKTKDKTKTCF